MNSLRSFIIPINDEVKHISAFCLHRDELFAGGGSADVIHKGEVPVRGQGSACPIRQAGSEQLQERGKLRPIQGEGEGARVRDGQVIGMDIALALRQKHLDPFVLGADDFHLRPVGKLGKCVVFQPRASADIQVSPAGGHSPDLLGLQSLRIRGKLDTLLGDRDGPQTAEQFGKLIQSISAGLRIIVASSIFIIGHSDLRGLGIPRGSGLCPGSFGVVGFAIPAAGKGRDSKGRGTERHGQGRRKQADDLLILHTWCPPCHSRQGPPRPPPPSCLPAG